MFTFVVVVIFVVFVKKYAQANNHLKLDLGCLKQINNEVNELATPLF